MPLTTLQTAYWNPCSLIVEAVSKYKKLADEPLSTSAKYVEVLSLKCPAVLMTNTLARAAEDVKTIA